MTEQIVKMYTPNGTLVGYFTDPKVDIFAGDHYELSGAFYDSEGKLAGKVEFNPQVLPYNADISSISGTPGKRLINIYVQRGRQPVTITGICPQDVRV